MEKALPEIPAKRYFTIGEVSELCGVKPYVLRYWEQEFSQLKPMKRRGNRRYYQHHEVLLIRRIRELLYDQGFTISGARNRLFEIPQREFSPPLSGLEESVDAVSESVNEPAVALALTQTGASTLSIPARPRSTAELTVDQVRDELQSIRSLLTP
ncbi:MAG: MerR family transcriptional regulator [Burkholderiaceae bacterium]